MIMLRVFLCVLSLLVPAMAQAHALQPGYLELQAMGEDSYRVHFAAPDVKGRPMAIVARLSEPCSVTEGPQPKFDGRAWIAQWLTVCPGGLPGVAINIDGLAMTQTDVLVRYELDPGQGESQRLTPEQTGFVVPEDPGALEVLTSYFWLGLDHIASGLDHLLFVFALLMLIRDPWTLFGAVTAFTIAHSITLAAAALGWARVPGPPVEAVIALSIMFLAAEILHRDPAKPRLSERAPWAVCFFFGLIHGLGFGSALQEIGLPRSEVALALLSFNVGVEAGQILFILAVVAVWMVARRLIPALLDSASRLFRGGQVLVPYAIGGVAAFWFVERVTGF